MLKEYGLDLFSARMERAALTEQLFLAWHYRAPSDLTGWVKPMPVDFLQLPNVEPGSLLPNNFHQLLLLHLHRFVRPKHQQLFWLILTTYALSISQKLQVIHRIFMDDLSEFQIVELTKVMESALEHLVELKRTELTDVLLLLQSCQLSIYWLLNHFGLIADNSLAHFIVYLKRSFAKEYLDIISCPRYRAENMFTQLDSFWLRISEGNSKSLLHRMWLDIWEKRAQQNSAPVVWLDGLQAELPKAVCATESLTSRLQQVGIPRHVWRQLNQLHQNGLNCQLSISKPLWLCKVLVNTPARVWPQDAFEWVNWYYLQTQTAQWYPDDPVSAAAVSLRYQEKDGWNAVRSVFQQNQHLLRVLLPDLDDKTRNQLICSYWAQPESHKKMALLPLLTSQPAGNTVLPLRITNYEPSMAIRLLTLSVQYQQQGLQWVNCLDGLQIKAALGLCAVFIVDFAAETYLAEVEPEGADRLKLVQLRDIANQPAPLDAHQQVKEWLAVQSYAHQCPLDPQLVECCREDLLRLFARRKISVPLQFGKSFPPYGNTRPDRCLQENYA